ncbi:MAG: hypothetical protein HY903_24730 [Deltaproteobacteria bacterium]|nr:hypothetical protein [Deltaproteobacteria bacterium]
MIRNVKGILFVDYVRMLRGRRDLDWARYLEPEDQPYLEQKILPDAWFPMATFERLGLAILHEVAQGDLGLVRAWGQASVDHLVSTYADLLVPHDPLGSLMRFQVLRSSFFDFPAIEFLHLSVCEAKIQVRYYMSPKAEEAACHQALGFFERLLQLAGAGGVATRFLSRSFAGDQTTMVMLTWST